MSNISSKWNRHRNGIFPLLAILDRYRNGVTQILVVIAILISIAVAVYSYPWLRGYALYQGYLPVAGRIAGHDSDLPGKALRCTNCHDIVQGAAPAARRIAPLTKAALTEFHPRRGGPKTTYTESSFCSLLQDGMDPAYVQVSRTMPRYNLSASSCHDLWSYVSSR